MASNSLDAVLFKSKKNPYIDNSEVYSWRTLILIQSKNGHLMQ